MKKGSFTQIHLQTIKNNLHEITNPLFKENINWLRYLFNENNINIIEFLAWQEIIKT